MLVSIEWLYNNLKDVKVVEIDYNPQISYYEGHIPGAVLINWRDFLSDNSRDFASPEKLSKVLGNAGINNDDLIVLYSDMNNRYAFYAYWILKAYGHSNLAILNGGIYKWLRENYPIDNDAVVVRRSEYKASKPDWSSRILVWELLSRLKEIVLIDSRSKEEYDGLTTAPPEHKCEQTQMSGHIPGAKNVPWTTLLNEDETMKPRDELGRIFSWLNREDRIVVYCRTGARASVVWYALKEVLGFRLVRLYDGSWVEYGNMVGVPVEKSISDHS
ncbi:sulfurtransferase [Saccharolobus shibatae]|uniref:Sulfurtransferase n=2 Tax=Saccharolobus shibatae TaxID=2286 RepID=A0A8F5GU58_SACSH|nr:sulfurtransferase [Saccharolobus shibatae]QXJ29595.1 Thiosulfate sulfurtransferase, rhodanese [Saccharolobus shibatae B12]QXJ32825.1 Thiosulfate sulfurtransferase, rhodanese [Saccharolobus shibatae]